MGRGRMGPSGGSGRGRMGSGGFGRSSFGGGSHRPRGLVPGATIVLSGRHRHSYSSGGSYIGIFVGAILILTGLFMMIGGISQFFAYSTVNAKCIKNDDVKGWYYATYEYTIDGEEYTNRSMQCWEFPEDELKTVEIYYLRSNPNKIYEECPTNKKRDGIIIAVGFVCTAIGILPFTISIKEIRKKKKSFFDSPDDEPVSGEIKEIYKRCPYCGAKYKTDSCPKCGASRID